MFKEITCKRNRFSQACENNKKPMPKQQLKKHLPRFHKNVLEIGSGTRPARGLLRTPS